MESFDYIIVGGGSAGCAVAYQLARANIGTIALLEAGYTNRVPQVKIPFGLVDTRQQAGLAVLSNQTKHWADAKLA